MKRYHLVASESPTGCYSEFDAENDVAAWVEADKGYFGRPVYLAEVISETEMRPLDAERGRVGK